jgi:hypothetical protein
MKARDVEAPEEGGEVDDDSPGAAVTSSEVAVSPTKNTIYKELSGQTTAQ